MKFKLVESIDDRLVETIDSRIKQFFGKTKIATSNPSGSQYLNYKTLQYIGFKEPSTQDCYVIHHINGDHKDDSFENRIIILKSLHDTIHNQIFSKIDEVIGDDENAKNYLGYMAKLQKIQTHIDDLNKFVKKQSLEGKEMLIDLNVPTDEKILSAFGIDLRKLMMDIFDKLTKDYTQTVVTAPHKYKKNRTIKTFKEYLNNPV